MQKELAGVLFARKFKLEQLLRDYKIIEEQPTAAEDGQWPRKLRETMRVFVQDELDFVNGTIELLFR